ncbi:MAG TPA: DinB family protein [Gemmatimonadetes bacterium]|nr:DinB family protein [Gemmatimonadota bacterium]
MTKPSLLTTVAVLLVAPLSLSAQNPVVQSLKGVFDVTKTNIMATAEMLNDEMYTFRPTDEVRSAGEILAHIADWQFIFCSSAAGEANPRTEDFEDTRTNKAGIIGALELGFAYCERVYAGTNDAKVMSETVLFGSPNTVAGALTFNSAHNYEHYGNLVTYMRLNGIVPPSSM